MNQQIALFFDIDGTLFDSKTKSILPSTKYMLEELRKRQNYDLYLSSGRSYVTLGTLKPYEKYIDEIILYKWNRVYPTDFYFDINLSTWNLTQVTEFKGNSHERITKEVYKK